MILSVSVNVRNWSWFCSKKVKATRRRTFDYRRVDAHNMVLDVCGVTAQVVRAALVIALLGESPSRHIDAILCTPEWTCAVSSKPLLFPESKLLALQRLVMVENSCGLPHKICRTRFSVRSLEEMKAFYFWQPGAFQDEEALKTSAVNCHPHFSLRENCCIFFESAVISSGLKAPQLAYYYVPFPFAMPFSRSRPYVLFFHNLKRTLYKTC